MLGTSGSPAEEELNELLWPRLRTAVRGSVGSQNIADGDSGRCAQDPATGSLSVSRLLRASAVARSFEEGLKEHQREDIHRRRLSSDHLRRVEAGVWSVGIRDEKDLCLEDDL